MPWHSSGYGTPGDPALPADLVDNQVLVSVSRIASSISFCLMPAAPWYVINCGISAEMIAVPMTHKTPPDTIEVLTLKRVATMLASTSPSFGPEV